MEVHHHPDLHHKKKNFKEYFLEFLMIFLAVTLGFFAETLRERITEKHREKDYIYGLINNIKSDTFELKGLIERNDLEAQKIDTLLSVSKDNFTLVPVQDSIYFYAEYAFGLHLFQFNDLTLVQLRNAGGYSLIKTSNIADSIALYESRNNDIVLQGKFYSDYGIQAWSSYKQVFDGTLSSKFLSSYRATNKIPVDMYVLISTDKEKMGVLFNNYWSFASVIKGYNNMLTEHLDYLKRFIVFLKDNYNIQ